MECKYSGILFNDKSLSYSAAKSHAAYIYSIFGSALRADFREDSDIDLLVEFDSNHIPGLIRLAGMEIELTEILGRKVDIRTPQDLSRYFRHEVVNNAEVQYAEV